MQLFKYLQSQGIGSRKECVRLIESGRVAVNGVVADDPRSTVAPDKVSTLSVDGTAYTVVPMPYFYIVLNKPEGYETSHKPQQYPSVFSLFPDHMRRIDMQAVGRLDADTTGILLITNDGGFNHRQTSPKHKVAKIYRVALKHPADETLCDRLKAGVLLHDENETVAAADAVLAAPDVLMLTITEGKYHQVKRMVAAAGNRVAQLHRTQFGGLTADDMPLGQWRFENL